MASVMSRTVVRRTISDNKSFENIRRVSKEFGANIDIDNNSVSGDVTFTYEAGEPKKGVTFMGMIVDLEDGMMYFSTVPNVRAPKFVSVNVFLSKISGRSVTRNVAIRAVEKFKLTGDLSKMEKELETTAGSMISRSLFTGEVGTVQVFRINLKEYVNTMLSIMKFLSRTFGRKVKFNKIGTDENGQTLLRDFQGLCRAVSSINVEKDLDFLKASTSAEWVQISAMRNKFESKGALLAANLVEIAAASDDAGELIVSSDAKKMVKQVGLDKILQPREISSIVSRPEIIDMAKKQTGVDAALSSIRVLEDYDDIESASVAAIRTSTSVLNKIVNKINSIVKG